MKPLPVLLGLSLIANAAFFLAGQPAHTDSDPTLHSAAMRDASSSPTQAPPAVRVASIWETLRAGDPAALVQLRAAGWPEDILHAIVVVLVDDLYRDRETALRFDSWGGTEYWKERSFGPQNARSLHALKREKQTLLKTILGPGYRSKTDAADLRYTGLSPEKAAAVAAIVDDYHGLLADLTGDSGFSRIAFPEDREKRAFLATEQRADLVRTLSPEELLEYDLRNSSSAAIMRVTMEAFEPTEHEFRALFPIQFENDERLRLLAEGDPKASAAVRAARTEAEAQTRQLLGDHRYAELLRSRDNDYRVLHELGRFLSLAPETAIAAHEVKTDIDTRARALKLPPNPDADALASHQAARLALADEAETRLGTTLGPRGLAIFETSSPFIKSLRAPSPAPKK